MKKLSMIILLLLAMCLFGCEDNSDKDKDKVIKEVSTALEYLNTTINEYNESNSVQVKMTFETGDVTQTINLGYTFNEQNVTVLSSVLKDKDGEVSVYVKDGICYLSRYNNTKEYYTLTSDEASKIVSDYSFNAYIEKVLEIFNNSFFENSTIENATNSTVELNCDVINLTIDPETPEDEVDAAEEELDKLRSMTSVKLLLTFANNKVTQMEGTFVNSENVTSTMKVEFISTEAPTVTVDPSKYTAK